MSVPRTSLKAACPNASRRCWEAATRLRLVTASARLKLSPRLGVRPQLVPGRCHEAGAARARAPTGVSLPLPLYWGGALADAASSNGVVAHSVLRPMAPAPLTSCQVNQATTGGAPDAAAQPFVWASALGCLSGARSGPRPRPQHTATSPRRGMTGLRPARDTV